MKNTTIVFTEPHHVALESEDLNFNAEGDRVLIETEYSLVSPGTELALYTGTHVGIDDPANKFAKYPFYPGYATVGRVVDAGPDAGLAPGDRVFALARHARYSAVSARNKYLPVVRLSDDQESRYAPFARLAAISMTALLRTHHRAGTRVAVFGMGMIGNFAAQLYTLAGCRVVGLDVVPERLEIARRTGVPDVIRSGPDCDLQEAVRESLAGDPEIVIEATGVPELTNRALELVGKLGAVVLLGSPRGNVSVDIYKHIHCKGVILTGAHEGLQGEGGLSIRREVVGSILGMIASGSVRVAPMLTHVLEATEARSCYEMLSNETDRALGILFQWK